MIFGLYCPSWARGDEFERFFANVWQLPWQRSAYERETFMLNEDCHLVQQVGAATLPESYSMKAVHLSVGIKHTTSL